jgi:aldehyde dehydrogenase (NAD+)
MKGTYEAVEIPAPDLAKFTQCRTAEVFAQDLFDKQKAYFATDVTKTYDWRIDQLDRLSRMLKKNSASFSEASRRDFKTAVQENIFEVSATIASIEFTKSQLKEWMKPVEAPIPKFLAESGHKGIVYREPYGVTLIICPFNGPLLLSLRPAATALSAGNPCIEAVGGNTRDRSVAARIAPEVFRARMSGRGCRQPAGSYRTFATPL